MEKALEEWKICDTAQTQHSAKRSQPIWGTHKIKFEFMPSTIRAAESVGDSSEKLKQGLFTCRSLFISRSHPDYDSKAPTFNSEHVYVSHHKCLRGSRTSEIEMLALWCSKVKEPFAGSGSRKCTRESTHPHASRSQSFPVHICIAKRTRKGSKRIFHFVVPQEKIKCTLSAIK